MAPSIQAASAAQPVKSAKECNEELAVNRTAISASGESVRNFVSDCWWHSMPGHPTPIKNAARVPSTSEVAPRQVAGPANSNEAAKLTPARQPTATSLKSEHSRRFAQALKSDLVFRGKPNRGRDRTGARHDASTEVRPQLTRANPLKDVEPNRAATGSSLGEARVGRRSWIALVDRFGGSYTERPAVLLTRKTIVRSGGLDCWTQPVFFTGRIRRERGRHWASSIVCDEKRVGSDLDAGHLTAYADIGELTPSKPRRHRHPAPSVTSRKPIGLEEQIARLLSATL